MKAWSREVLSDIRKPLVARFPRAASGSDALVTRYQDFIANIIWPTNRMKLRLDPWWILATRSPCINLVVFVHWRVEWSVERNLSSMLVGLHLYLTAVTCASSSWPDLSSLDIQNLWQPWDQETVGCKVSKSCFRQRCLGLMPLETLNEMSS